MNEPIRVLCVFSRLDRGGAESMCMNIYRNIDHSKVQFDFIKHTSDIGAFEDEIKSMGGRIYEAPGYRVWNHIFYCAWWCKHLKSHPEHQIIHGHYFTISPIYFKVAKKYGRRTVGHSHSMKGNVMHLPFLIKMLILRNIGKYTDHAFACSEESGKWVFHNKKFIVLNNAIEAKKFSYNPVIRKEVQSELGIEGYPVVGIVGSLIPVKNPLEVVRIFKSLSSKQPLMRLLWIGDGYMREEIKKILTEGELINNVVMTGTRPDINRMMQAMDVFILPSRSEGLPVVVIEAQAAGLPVICSDAVSTEAAITDICYFLPLGCPDVWADAIQKASVKERKDMQNQIIDAGYDINTTVKALENFYLSL